VATGKAGKRSTGRGRPGPFSETPHAKNPLFRDGIRIRERKTTYDWARGGSYAVFRDKRLTDADVRFYTLLLKWTSNVTSEAHVNLNWLADRLDAAPITVKRWMARLRKCGYVALLERRRGSKRLRSVYYVEQRAVPLPRRHDILKIGIPPSKKDTEDGITQ